MEQKVQYSFFPNSIQSLVVDPSLSEMQSPLYSCDHLVVFQGVSHSRPNTEDISLCYANRSAALFHLGQYEVSIEEPGVLPVAAVENELLSVLLHTLKSTSLQTLTSTQTHSLF